MYNDADIAMAQAHADADAIHDAAALGGVPFDSGNPEHRAIVEGAVESAWYGCASVTVAVVETLADYGIAADLDQPGLCDTIFAASDALRR
jgi:hypothetical protein